MLAQTLRPADFEILIVDDEPVNVSLLEAILQKAGYRTHAALNGPAGLLAAQEIMPDLVLLDILMPGLDGYEVCRRLKAEPTTQGVPVIFISALHRWEDKVTAFQVGGVDYLPKPFYSQEVLARVRLHLALCAARRELEARNARLQREIAEREQAEQERDAALAQLRDYARELEHKVNERTAALERSNLKLQELGRMKDEFLANMSHELRTPLSTILNTGEILQEQIFGSLTDKQIEYLQIIDDSGRHLLSLISDILDLAKIGVGKLELDPVDLSPLDICRGCLELISPSAQRKKITLESACDATAGLIQADPRRLKQILVNLLGNAVKFTPEGGRVGLGFRGDPANRRVCFEVWDTGIGIAEDLQGKLFQPFVQLDGRLSRQYGGAGLGLALVKSLVDLHGGDVALASKPNQGCRVTVSLPWQPSAPPALPEQAAQSAGGPPPVTVHAGKTVLIAEDNAATLENLAAYLSAKGYRAETARDGGELLDKARRDPPDIVLVDMQMPGMDGLEATRRMRADPRLAHVPIIALTALAMPGDRERCLRAGAAAYLDKPVKMQELLRTIASLLGAGGEQK